MKPEIKIIIAILILILLIFFAIVYLSFVKGWAISQIREIFGNPQNK